MNPARIKLELFCRGLKIDPSCELESDARPVLRTRAGLGSGLEIVLPSRMRVNAPVEEHFVRNTPYSLHKERGAYVLRRDGKRVTRVRLPPRPGFYDLKTRSGKTMSTIGVMQGTYLAIYPGRVCSFWRRRPRENCRFCSTGLNVGRSEALDKTVDDVLEVARAARKECGITYVHFNTGYLEGGEIEFLEPFVRAVKENTGLLIGVQTTPAPNLDSYRRLARLGVNNVSFCFELWDEKRLAEVCPGKSAEIGRDRYLEAIKFCRRYFPAVNGEIIAGLEPVESTLEAIDWITANGAQPTVCVFRPCLGTDLEDLAPPTPEELVPVFRRQYEACIRNGVPIGIAPNIRVSLVILPEEGRSFSTDRSPAFRLGEARNAALRAAFRAVFKLQMGRARLGKTLENQVRA
ncbi:MAG: radical SAM protein [bacterium]